MRNTIIIAAIALYFTQVGSTKALADCTYAGDTYTVGSSVCQDDGNLHWCAAAGNFGCTNPRIDCWTICPAPQAVCNGVPTKCLRPDSPPTRILFKPTKPRGGALETRATSLADTKFH